LLTAREAIIMTAMETAWIILVILAALAAVLCLVAIWDDTRFVTRKYTIRSAKVSKKLTFVFVSDLHEKEYGPHNEKLIRAIEAIHPDAVLSGGDNLIAKKAMYDTTESFMERPLALYGALAKEFPVFAVNGNHEDAMRQPEYNEECPGYEGSHIARDLNDAYEEKLRAAGVISLHNKRVRFSGIDLVGLELPHESYDKLRTWEPTEDVVEETLGFAPDPEVFTLLVTHNPKYFPQYAHWGADASLCGHIHGGIVRFGRHGLLSPDYTFFPTYCCGEYHLYAGGFDHTLIVSCGMGTHTVPVRIGNPAELVTVTILPEEN
jgi:predicted MPP superfamily phosphohydrolase